jgi:hypothetical protein
MFTEARVIGEFEDLMPTPKPRPTTSDAIPAAPSTTPCAPLPQGEGLGVRAELPTIPSADPTPSTSQRCSQPDPFMGGLLPSPTTTPTINALPPRLADLTTISPDLATPSSVDDHHHPLCVITPA